MGVRPRLPGAQMHTALDNPNIQPRGAVVCNLGQQSSGVITNDRERLLVIEDWLSFVVCPMNVAILYLVRRCARHGSVHDVPTGEVSVSDGVD